MNLLDMLKDQVSGSLVNQASSFLGADKSGIDKALGGIFPALLGKMISTSEENGGAKQIFDMATNMDSSMLGNINDLFGGGAGNVAKLMNSGSGVLNLLLGNSSSGLIDKISQFSGLKGSAASSLIKMAAPFLMSMVGKQIKDKALDVMGLGKLLGSQKSVVQNAMPNSLMSSLGAGFLGKGMDALKNITGEGVNVGKKAVGGAMDVADGAMDLGKKTLSGAANLAGDASDAAVKTGGSLLKWILPALLALAVLGYFGTKTGCNAVDNAAAKVSETTSSVAKGASDMAGDAVDATKDAASAVSESVSAAFGKVDDLAKAALDKITFTAGSVGDQMTKYISGGMVGEAKFRFNNLNFETGSATLDPASRVEIDNLAAILKAYPALKLQITGYTDNTGNAENNLSLSKARAASVKARLIQQSIVGNRIATEGMGAANPVESNDTAEGRAANRRIEVTLLK